MNIKQYFGALKQFSFIKLLNIVVILSMLLTSCGLPQKRVTDEKPMVMPEKKITENNYEPPVYTHPEPVTGKRPANNEQNATSPAENDTPSIMFVENVGQFDEGARFQAKSEWGTMYLANNAVWITLLKTSPEIGTEGEDLPTISTPVPGDPQISPTPTPDNGKSTATVGVNLRLSFGKANLNSKVEGFDPLDSSVSYFAGNDSNEWNADAPAWGGVRYVDFYPGYNLEITSEADSLYWRFVQNETSSTEPGVVENEIRLQIEGADSLTLNENKVEISTVAGSISLPLPELVTSPSSLKPEPDTNSIKPILDGDEIILPFELSVSELQPTGMLGSNFTEISLPNTDANALMAMDDMYVSRPITSSIRSRSATPLSGNSSTTDTFHYSRYIRGGAMM
jgi:hypothetical protein